MPQAGHDIADVQPAERAGRMSAGGIMKRSRFVITLSLILGFGASLAWAEPTGDPLPEGLGYEMEPAEPENQPAKPAPRLEVPALDEARPPRPENQAELEDLERRMRMLGGQIQDLRSEVLSLGEDISTGFVTGTKLLVLHENNLGKAFEIESVEYKLDGFTVYTSDDVTRLKGQNMLVVFDASVLPGNHTMDVVYTLRATGYGLFTYMEEYRFELRSQYHFSTPRDHAVELAVEAVDRGVGAELRDRPALKFTVR